MTTNGYNKKIIFFVWGMLMIALSMGDSIRVFNMNLSRVCMLLLLLLTFIDMICSDRIVFMRGKNSNFVLFFSLFWLVYSLLQIMWVEDISLWLQGMVSNTINILLMLELWYLICNSDGCNEILKYSSLLWFFNIGLGIYEIVTHNHFIYEGVSYWDRDMVRTFFGNPNDCATWLVLSFLLFSFYLNRRSKKAINALVWIITTVVVTRTGARACIYGMYIYMIIYMTSFVLLKFKSAYGINSIYKIWGGLSFLMLILIVVICMCTDLIRTILIYYSGVGNLESDFFRLQIIGDTIKVIFDSLFMGAGAYQTISLIGINPHNFLLELFSDYGFIVFGGACYIGISIMNVFFDKKKIKEIRAFHLAYVFTFIMISISSSSMNRLRLAWISLIIIFLSINHEKDRVIN